MLMQCRRGKSEKYYEKVIWLTHHYMNEKGQLVILMFSEKYSRLYISDIFPLCCIEKWTDNLMWCEISINHVTLIIHYDE